MRFCILYFILILLVYPSAAKIDLIRSIGDDSNDEYIFFMISGAVMSDQKDIFVADIKGYYVSKYNWEGVFQKRVGQHGRGPKDFLGLQHLRYFKNRIYIMDWKNNRIASADTDLENFEYFTLGNFKYKSQLFRNMVRDYFCLDENRFLGLLPLSQKSQISLCIINKKEKTVEKTFHDYMPIDKSLLIISAMSSTWAEPIVGINYRSRRLIASSRISEKNIKFFIYTFSGELVKMSTLEQEKNFEFPIQLFNTPVRDRKKLKEKINYSGINSIHSMGDYFLVVIQEFLNVEQFGAEANNEIQSFILVLDKNGNFIYKQKIPKFLHIYYISPDGYVLAKDDTEEDVQKLLIYKLELKK